MKYKFLYFSLILAGIIFQSCGKEATIGQTSMDDIAPAPPTNVKVENINGAAIITYTPPLDNDLAYVQATYYINGIKKEVKSSIYKDELKVEGFGKAQPYDVVLNSVDRSQNVSESVDVTVNPLTPPVLLLSESVQIVASFGGVRITWLNEKKAEVIACVMAEDSVGTMKEMQFLYTSLEDGRISLRGFDTLPRNFGIYFRDRWDNYSDTIIEYRKPRFEELIPKKNFSEYRINGPEADAQCNYELPNIWNENIADFYHTMPIAKPQAPLPVMNTFDMGLVVELSRFKMWQRKGNDEFYYRHNNPRRFELWGSLTAPNRQGTLTDANWIKLIDANSFQPSGSGPGICTNEDSEFADAGEEFEFPGDLPPVRYIRFVMKESWGGTVLAQMAEITFWGKVVSIPNE